MKVGERVLTPPGSHVLCEPSNGSVHEGDWVWNRKACHGLPRCASGWRTAGGDKVREESATSLPFWTTGETLSLSWAAHLSEKPEITPSQPPTKTGTVYLRAPWLTQLTCNPHSSEDAFSYWHLFSPTVLISGKTPA